MHSFHHSRGRVLFEFVCALGIVASSVGAWKQTGASALLVAAFVAGLYGFVHLFDLRRRDSAEAVEPQRIEFEAEVQVELPAFQDTCVPLAVPDQQPATDGTIEDADVVEPAAPPAGKNRRAKSSRKGGSRRAGAPQLAEVTELAPPEEAEVAVAMVHEEEEVAGLVPPEEAAHPPLAPLFEPEPFVRQQRAVFGRKAG